MNFTNPPPLPFDKQDSDIVRALGRQVLHAYRGGPPGSTELDVVTVITRPMWEAFLRFAGLPAGTTPTAWIGTDSVRVWGSETHVIESEEWWSVSRIRE